MAGEAQARFTISARDRASAQVKGLRRSLMGLKNEASALSGALGGLSGVVTAGGLAMMARKAIDAGSKISDLATRVNTGVEEIQALNFAAQEAGASQESMERALRNMEQRLGQAANGTASYRDAVERLGLNVQELIELPQEKRLEAISRAYANASDKTRAYSDVSRILGQRAAPELMEVLQRLATEGFDKVSSSASKAGQIMAEDMVQDMDDAADKLAEFETVVTNFAANAVSAFMKLGNAIGEIPAKMIFGNPDIIAVEDYIDEARQNLKDRGEYNRRENNRGKVLREAARLMAEEQARIAEIATVNRERFGTPGGGRNLLGKSGAMAELESILANAEASTAAFDASITAQGKVPAFDVAVKGFEGVAEGVKEAASGFREANAVIQETSQSVSAWETDAVRAVQSTAYAIEDGLVNAAKQGKVAFGDMADFILSEMMRIFIRSQILRPLFGAIGGMFSSAGFDTLGGAFSSAFGGGKAGGGAVSGGMSYLVGERGPELFTPATSGSINPNPVGGPTFNVDMRGADVAAVARLERMVAQINGSIEQRAVSAVGDSFNRNPAFLR